MNKILEFEFLRGIAAFYVFFHHTLFQFNIVEKNSLFGKLFSFGQEAVMLFFLLSGYVIALSLIKKDYSFSEYLKHRFLRIYPILLFVMIVSIILKFLTNDLNIDFYSFIINLLMLQDIGSLKPGTFAEPFLGNSPLWSLSYEWWFYMIFFVHFMFYKKIFNNISFLYYSGFVFSILGLLSYFFFYNQISLIIMYYYIWLSGAIICIIFINKLPNKKHLIIKVLALYFSIIIIYFLLFVLNQEHSSIGVHPLLELRHYITSFIFLIIALFYTKYFYIKLKNNLFYQKLLSLGIKPASISFGVYVIHYPIMNFFLTYNEKWGGEINESIGFILTFIFTLILSYIAEIKIYGNIYNKFIKRKRVIK